MSARLSRDELKSFRYVGALPGMLVQGLRKVGVSNPLILLDELDKGGLGISPIQSPLTQIVPVGTSNFHGDPSAALLETLDPAQNWAFHDQYVILPYQERR